jgi:uncharacterized membrane protein YhdT
MKLSEDPRVGVALRTLALAWTFYTVFLAAVLGVAAAAAGSDALLFGLPRWVALSCLVVPPVFVLALIPIIEWGIPNVPLGDDEEDAA